MKLLLLILSCAALAACPSTQVEHPQSAPTRTPSRCSFSFLAPPDLVQVEVQGIDSCVDEFRGDDCTYYADHGWYADPLEPEDGRHDYEAQQIAVDGARAQLVQFRVDDQDRPYFVGILMRDIDPDSPDTALSFQAQCSTARARDAAAEVVRSVMRDG